MRDLPKITVYMPSYNYGQYIDQAIQSVIRQTMQDWELIVIDDGSTDDTLEVIKKYKSNSNIRIVEQENKGLNITNNIAIRLASGKYVVRVDADDFLEENMLLVLSNVLDTKPDIGLVYPDYYNVDQYGRIIELVRRKKIAEEVELLDLPAHGACTMIRKEILQLLGGYDESFKCQDGYDLWLRATRQHKPYNVNIPLFYYRQHATSLTRNEAKILETRREIKKKFVDTFHEGIRPAVLAVIPVIKHPLYPQANPFQDLVGVPLIEYTIKAALESESIVDIVVAADDEGIIQHCRDQFPEIKTFLREASYSKSNIRMGYLVHHILEEVTPALKGEPDAICTLFINCPLRKAKHIEKAIDTMVIFKVDTVVSVEEELAYCYQHQKNGLAAIRKSRQNLRVEREAIYKENGAIYLSRTSLIKEGRMRGDIIGHISMLPEDSINIKSQLDLWMAEKILTEWKEKQMLAN